MLVRTQPFRAVVVLQVVSRIVEEVSWMAETLVQFQTPVAAPDRKKMYRARACGSSVEGGTWQGWIEFDPVDGGEPVRSSRETTQPNRVDTEYWATGLTQVYLEGALSRALNPLVVTPAPHMDPPRFERPARLQVGDARSQASQHSVLDPFSVYQKGETLLRRQLGALSAWHLVNIAVDYELSGDDRTALNRMPAPALVDLIVHAVRVKTEGGAVDARRRK
jgi:hypothetical protein